jgi:hypothetical protein
LLEVESTDVKDSQQEEYMFGCFVMLNKVFYFV